MQQRTLADDTGIRSIVSTDRFGKILRLWRIKSTSCLFCEDVGGQFV